MTNTLLISEKYVKTQSNIQDNVWGDFLTPAIREAQDIELQPIIGRPLYKKILKEVEEKDVEERFKTLIEDWIQPYLLYQTIVSLIPIIGTKLGNIGTVISNDEHVQNISSSERENLEYRYRYLADHYKSELQKYLLANKDLYPELTSTCLKNLNLKSSNSLPLWTGGIRHGQKESTDCPDKADYADPDGRKAGYIEEGKTVTITATTGTTTIVPDEGYEGFSSVELNINAQYPQILLKGQTLYNQHIIIDDDSITSASLKDYFIFDENNISNYQNFFNNFQFINNKNINIFDGDFSSLGTIDLRDKPSNFASGMFSNLSANNKKEIKINNTIIDCYEIKLPKIILGDSFDEELISSPLRGTFDNKAALKIDINQINFEYYTNNPRGWNFDIINDLYIDDVDYFKNLKINSEVSIENGYLFTSLYFDNGNENDFLNLNYVLKQIRGNYYRYFRLEDYMFGNFDISEVIWDNRKIFSCYYTNFGVRKIKVSEKTFSMDGFINTYVMISPLWTDQQNLQDFIDALPQNTTSRTIQLSSNTMNALTDEMKATAANKNWTLTT